MTFPNPEEAIIDLEKLRNYCLNPDHPRGKHKASVFRSALGIKQSHASTLKALIKKTLPSASCIQGNQDSFGIRFTTDLPLEFQGKSAVVRVAWIMRTGVDYARLTTCFIK